jgi:hypothetical protein
VIEVDTSLPARRVIGVLNGSVRPRAFSDCDCGVSVR